MARMESKGNLYRIKQCAIDLLSTEDDLVCEVEEEISWELIDHNLRLKSTFMYCDLNCVISGTRDGEVKQTLTQLANRFFDHMEELQNAVKFRNISETQSCYNELVVALRELMAVLLPPN